MKARLLDLLLALLGALGLWLMFVWPM